MSSFYKHLIIGALLAGLVVYYKISSSGMTWEGEGFNYNISRLGGGIVAGAFIGILIYSFRNKSLKVKSAK